MPVADPLPKNRLCVDLGEVVSAVLVLKGAGASNDLVSKALSNPDLPEEVKKVATSISNAIPTGYFLTPRYQQEPPYSSHQHP